MELPRPFMIHYMHLCILKQRAPHLYDIAHAHMLKHPHSRHTHHTLLYKRWKPQHALVLLHTSPTYSHTHTHPTPKREITFPLPQHSSTCHPPTAHSHKHSSVHNLTPTPTGSPRWSRGSCEVLGGHLGGAEKRGAVQRSGTKCSMVRRHR